MSTGFLHPGSMGASLAAACRDATVWASNGRSPETSSRATHAGMRDCVTLEAMSEECDVIVSICPPSAAVSVAESIAGYGFDGIYVDANAIAPATSRAISERFERFVDGAVVGPPARRPGTTRLYLSGPEAATVAARWDGSIVDARLIESAGGAAASALKAAYAGWTKGTTALLLATLGLAAAEGITDGLIAEWSESQPDLPSRVGELADAVAPRAWRWVGEMSEIAAAMNHADLPAGFHDAAAEIFRRLADLRVAEEQLTVDDLVDALRSATDEWGDAVTLAGGDETVV